MATEKEKMIAERFYIATDPQLTAERTTARKICDEFNRTTGTPTINRNVSVIHSALQAAGRAKIFLRWHIGMPSSMRCMPTSEGLPTHVQVPQIQFLQGMMQVMSWKSGTRFSIAYSMGTWTWRSRPSLNPP